MSTERKCDGEILIPVVDEKMKRAGDFSVEINGIAAPVIDMEVGAAASFLMGETPAVVRIRTDKDMSNTVVRPLNRGLKAEPDGPGACVIKIDRPGNFSVEFNGDIRRPLFIFASDISLARCPENASGGIIRLESGKTHRFDEMRLTSGQTLFLEPGAVLEAPLRASGADDITITGAGIIDSRYRTDAPNSALHFTDCSSVLIRGVHIIDSWGWTTHLQKCRNVHLENVKETCWRPNCDGVDINASSNVHISDSFIYSTDDCIAIKSTAANESSGTFRDGEKGRVNTASDGAAVQLGASGILVERTVFWNCTGGNAMEIGFELCGSAVRGIAFRDCDIIRVERGACFSIHDADDAPVSGIVFEDIRVEDARDELLDLYVGLSIYSSDCPDEYHRRRGFVLPPELRDNESGDNFMQWVVMPEGEYEKFASGRGKIEGVLVSGISIHGSEVPRSIIKGYDKTHCIRGVAIRGITAGGRKISGLDEMKIRMKNAYDVKFLC